LLAMISIHNEREQGGKDEATRQYKTVRQGAEDEANAVIACRELK